MKDTSQRLLDEAERLFSEHGIESVGVQDIVEAAGLTKPSLYHHWGSRAGLVGALLARGFGWLESALNEAPPYRGSLPDTLKAQWDAWFQVVNARPAFFRIAFSLSLLPKGNETADLVRPHLEALQTRMSALFLNATPVYGNMRGRENLLASTWLALLQHWTRVKLDGWSPTGTFPERDELLRPFLYGLFS